jgi:GNAT superfamily N-acetyltransferase
LQYRPADRPPGSVRHNGAVPPLPDPISTVPGATWRPLTLDDAAAYVRLHEEARVADAGQEVMSEEVARHELTDPGCPLVANTLALEAPGGSLAASIMVHERLQGIDSRRIFLWGVTHPAHRGLGVGRAALAGALARADEILAGEPAALVRVVEAFKDVRLADAIALHEAAGFRPARWYFDMRRDLREPLPGMPALRGIRLEPYLAVMAEPVRLAHNEAFADRVAASQSVPPEPFVS